MDARSPRSRRVHRGGVTRAQPVRRPTRPRRPPGERPEVWFGTTGRRPAGGIRLGAKGGRARAGPVDQKLVAGRTQTGPRWRNYRPSVLGTLTWDRATTPSGRTLPIRGAHRCGAGGGDASTVGRLAGQQVALEPSILYSAEAPSGNLGGAKRCLCRAQKEAQLRCNGCVSKR